MAVTNRAYIEKLVYDTFNAIDPSGINTDKYKSMFTGMNDKEFEKFMKEFLADDQEYFMLDITEFEHDVRMENCEKAAKVIGFPLMEYVYMPHLTMDKKRVIVSKEKCLIGIINGKRTQQILYKKNGLSISNEKVSALTGQVVDKDKNARVSDIEGSLLVSLGAEHILQEYYGPRADDPIMKREMNQSIATKGYVLLEELENVSTNKVTLNTINAYLLSMGLISDMVTDSYILPKTSSELFE